MAETIFFSWQSDVPNKVGRSLIEKALENAIGQVRSDLLVEEPDRETDLRIDKDRQGVPGMPPIVDTIFSKIDKAIAVVVDVTFAGRRPNGDPIPNPNVMIEYGWALKSRSYNRVIGVMNKAYGDPNDEQLPFDMRHLGRPIVYHLPADASSDAIAAAKKALSSQFAGHLREILNLQGETQVKAPVKRFMLQDSATTPGRFRVTTQPLGRNDVIPGRQQWEVSMPIGPVTFLRLMPVEDQGKTWANDELELAAMGPTRGQRFEIFGATNFQNIGFFRAPEGWGLYPVGENPSTANCCSFVFRTGEIWGIDQLTPGFQPGSLWLDRKMWIRTLENYRKVLLNLGVRGPFKWIGGIEDAKDRTLAADGTIQVFLRKQSVAPRIIHEGTLTPEESTGKALEPFFREVYNACGMTYAPMAEEVAN